MKRLKLLFIILLATAVTTGCQHGRWRLRGARCRPGMTMPTYAQTTVPAVPGAAVAAPCQPGYPAASYPPAGLAPTGYAPGGYMMPGGYMPGGYIPSEGFVPGETVTSDNAVGEFQTTPIPMDGTTEVQRPYFESPQAEGTVGDVITVPGPETGPLPSG
jgi:hypothetical protein